MTRSSAALLTAVVLSGTALTSAPASAQRPTATLLDSAVLRTPRLSEGSGITPSRRRPGVFWALNDSGDGPWLYATDSAGTDLGRIRVEGATTLDWEDLSSGPCTRSAGH